MPRPSSFLATQVVRIRPPTCGVSTTLGKRVSGCPVGSSVHQAQRHFCNGLCIGARRHIDGDAARRCRLDINIADVYAMLGDDLERGAGCNGLGRERNRARDDGIDRFGRHDALHLLDAIAICTVDDAGHRQTTNAAVLRHQGPHRRFCEWPDAANCCPTPNGQGPAQ